MLVATARHPGPPPPVRRDPNARPLYLMSQGDTLVSLDGPALAIRRDGQAERLLPLRRLARVYSHRRIRWDSDALLACADLGISLIFVDDQGAILARLLGRPGERDELRHRFNEFLLLPQAPAMYEHWLNGLRFRLAHWAGIRVDAPPHLREPRACRLWIARQATQYANKRGEEITRQWLRGLAYGWMQAHLRELGFGADNELGQAGEPALAHDLTDLLMWYLEPARLGWLRRRWLAAQRKNEPVLLPTHAEAVRLFEGRVVRIETRGRELVNSLHRWLIHEA